MWLLTCAGLWPFSTVFRAALFAIGHTNRIQRSANHVITNTRQVFHPASSNKDNRVFLQVVTNTGDVGCNFNPIGQPDARDFAQRRIRFLWCLCVNARANAPFLWRALERRASRFVLNLLTAFANKLIYRRHCFPLITRRILRAKGLVPASFRNQSGSQRRPLPC